MTAGPFIWICNGRRLPLGDRFVWQLPSINELAHSLSQINRWTGWAAYPISVAQHSVMVSFLVRPELAMHGLLHDAHECLVGDVNTPVKRWIKSERLADLSECFDADMRIVYGLRPLTPEEDAELKLADLCAAYGEAIRVVGVERAEVNEHFGEPPDEMRPMLERLPAPVSTMLAELSWRVAREAFLVRYRTLAGQP